VLDRFTNFEKIYPDVAFRFQGLENPAREMARTPQRRRRLSAFAVEWTGFGG